MGCPWGAQDAHAVDIDGFHASARSPTRQARPMDRQLGRQVDLVRKERPVHVLHADVAHGFVRGVQRVLQIQHTATRRRNKAGPPRPEGKSQAKPR